MMVSQATLKLMTGILRPAVANDRTAVTIGLDAGTLTFRLETFDATIVVDTPADLGATWTARVEATRLTKAVRAAGVVDIELGGHAVRVGAARLPMLPDAEAEADASAPRPAPRPADLLATDPWLTPRPLDRNARAAVGAAMSFVPRPGYGRDNLRGACIEPDGSIISSDGHRLRVARCAMAAAAPPVRSVVPMLALQYLERADTAAWCEADGWRYLVCSGVVEAKAARRRGAAPPIAVAWTAVVRLPAYQHYPDYSAVIPEAFPTWLELRRHAFADALRCALPLEDKRGALTMRLEANGSLALHVDGGPLVGTFDCELGADAGYRRSGPDAHVVLNVRYLLDAIDEVTGPTVMVGIIDDGSAVAIRGLEASDMALVMPVRP